MDSDESSSTSTQLTEEKRMARRPRWVQVILVYWKALLAIAIPILFLPLPLLDPTARGRCAYMVRMICFALIPKF